MKQVKLFLLAAFVIVLSACSTLNFDQRLAIMISGVTEVRTQTLTALRAKKITPNDAQNLQDQADTARAGLEIARTLYGSNPQAAEQRLEAARLALQGLQAYLLTRK